MKKNTQASIPEAAPKRRGLARIFLTLLLIFCAIGAISAYAFYYNYQEAGAPAFLLTGGLVTLAVILLYVPEYRLHKVLQILLAVLLPYINLVLLEWCTHNPWETMSLGAFALNMPFFYLLLLLIFFLSGSLRAALVIESAFSLFVGLANYFVILFRSTPILPWDLYSLGVASSVASNYTYSIDWQVGYVLLAFIVVFVLESRITLRWRKPKIRLACLIPWAAAVCGYLSILWIPNLQDYFDIDNTLFTPGYMYRTNGFMTAFLMDTRYLHVSAPNGYSDTQAEQLLADADDGSDQPMDHKPNIIVIMDEAFSDPGILGEFETSMDCMPFVHALQQGAANTVTGYMYASVLGGNTANTEFEFLTGNSMAFLPAGSIPYQQYIFDQMPGITSYLKDAGYQTIAMHPYNSTGWNRNKIYDYFSFDQMYFVSSFQGGERLRKYISDACLFDRITTLYEEKPVGTPLFSFSVTMQNHSGYSNDYNGNLNVDVTADEINSSYLNNYLSLMKYTDEALEDLISYFAGVEEDTILLFFGDHQPNDFYVKGIYKRNGIDYDSISFEEHTKRYAVPFVLWANFDIEEETGVEISANYLSNLLFEKANLPMYDYQKLLAKLRRTMPVITANFYKDTAGTIYPISDRKSAQDELRAYEMVQYYRMFAK